MSFCKIGTRLGIIFRKIGIKVGNTIRKNWQKERVWFWSSTSPNKIWSGAPGIYPCFLIQSLFYRFLNVVRRGKLNFGSSEISAVLQFCQCRVNVVQISCKKQFQKLAIKLLKISSSWQKMLQEKLKPALLLIQICEETWDINWRFFCVDPRLLLSQKVQLHAWVLGNVEILITLTIVVKNQNCEWQQTENAKSTGQRRGWKNKECTKVGLTVLTLYNEN